MQAAFTDYLFSGYIQFLTQPLQDSLRVLAAYIMCDAVYATGATVYSTDSSQMFAFHSCFTFLRTSADTQANSNYIALLACMSWYLLC